MWVMSNIDDVANWPLLLGHSKLDVAMSTSFFFQIFSSPRDFVSSLRPSPPSGACFLLDLFLKSVPLRGL